jgi:hypothetical protein
MKTPEELAEAIIQRANDGYHHRGDYPSFAITPWDDRLRWSDYIKKVAKDVLTEELQSA